MAAEVVIARPKFPRLLLASTVIPYRCIRLLTINRRFHFARRKKTWAARSRREGRSDRFILGEHRDLPPIMPDLSECRNAGKPKPALQGDNGCGLGDPQESRGV